VAGGVVVTLAVVGILAAVAVPAYQGYTQKVAVAGAYVAGREASVKVERYLSEEGRIPTLAQAGIAAGGSGAVRALSIDPDTAVLRVVTNVQGQQGPAVLVFEPSMDEHKRIAWECTGEGILPQALPQGCH
jgi:Tfp pilus assembly protein PilE